MCWILERYCISTPMKQLRYILSLLFFFLGFFSENLKAEVVILESEKIESFSEQDFNEISEEQVWLGLLHLQEEPTCQKQKSPLQFLVGSFSQNFSGELYSIRISKNLESSFQLGKKSTSRPENSRWNEEVFHGNPDLVDSWEVLGESADLRKNIDALETIEYYTKNVNGNIDELADAFKTASNKEDWFSGIIAEIRSKARNLPGTSKGNGVVIEVQWMRGTEGNLGLFPKQVADKLKGREFKNFAEFRSEFWKAVADDPDLAKQFSPGNQGAMKI